MTERLQSKSSERFHSIVKEPQTTACGEYLSLFIVRGLNGCEANRVIDFTFDGRSL